MNEVKPKFFVSHDANGLHIWLSRKRPLINRETGLYECQGATKMRIPYSWFGHMMRENSIHGVDIEALVIASVDVISL